MEQSHADWVETYIRDMESARCQCHDSYAGDVDELLSLSCNAARGVTEFEHSPVPNELLEEVLGPQHELLTSNRDNMCKALVDAFDFIHQRSQENVETGLITPRDPNGRVMAEAKEIVARGQGKHTLTTITGAIKDGALVHVMMAVNAWEVRKTKANEDCDAVGSYDVSALGVALFNDINTLHRIIGFSTDKMKMFEEILTRSIQDDINHEVDEVLGDQPDRIEGILHEIQREQAEIREGIEGIRETVEGDRPPRYFLLVPPLKKSFSERVIKILNPCSQTFHMYFVCRAFVDDLKKIPIPTESMNAPTESMNASPEFSEPLLVKQSAEFVENHKMAINVGLKVTNVLLKVATNEVGLGDAIPAFKVKNFTRLTKFAQNLRAQVGEHDRDHNDREYERLRTFLDEHHNKEWRIAVAAKLKHVVQGRHHAHVCKQNASHEEEWRNSIRAIQARAFHFGV